MRNASGVICSLANNTKADVVGACFRCVFYSVERVSRSIFDPAMFSQCLATISGSSKSRTCWHVLQQQLLSLYAHSVRRVRITCAYASQKFSWKNTKYVLEMSWKCPGILFIEVCKNHAFLCRQWNMNCLSRAVRMNRHFLYLSVYKPKYDWMTKFICCTSALRSHTKFEVRAFTAGIWTRDLWVASQACYHACCCILHSSNYLQNFILIINIFYAFLQIVIRVNFILYIMIFVVVVHCLFLL